MARRYQFKLSKDGPPIDEDFLGFIDELFGELNIPPDHVDHMVAKYQGFVGRRIASDTATREREIDALKAELGGGYAGAIAAGRKASLALGLSPADLDKLAAENGLPATTRLLAKIGARLGASSGAGSGSGGNSDDPLNSPQEARAELARLSGSREWGAKLLDPKAEGHHEAKARSSALHAAAYPAAERVAAPASPAAAAGDASRASAKAKIEGRLSEPAFMAALRDTSHTEHKASRVEFDQLHVEAGLK